MSAFVDELRAHRGQNTTYAPLFGIFADARLDEVPFRHEALYVDDANGTRFHYHGEGSLADPESWSCDGSDSTFHERTPRALWLCLLLDGNDEAAFHVWVNVLGADASVPVVDAESRPGAALAALLTAYFHDARHDFRRRFDLDERSEELWRDAHQLLTKADADPSPADVDAYDLAAIRARWRLRLSRRLDAALRLRSVESVGVPPSMDLRGMMLDQAASGLSLTEAIERLEPGTIDGLIVAHGVDSSPLEALKGSMRLLVGGSPSAALRFGTLELFHAAELSAADLRAFARSSARLRSLRGYRAPIGPEGFDALAEIDAFSELQDLHLAGARPGTGADAWLRSGRTRHLHSLALRNRSSGDITYGLKSMDVFAAADWSELRALDLTSNEAFGEHAAAFAANPTLGPLRHLGLEGTRTDAEGIEALAACAKLAQLEHLDLYRTRAGRGLVAIGKSPFLKKLRCLRVTLVDDDVVRAFVEHAAFENLQELMIERSQLSDSIASLADARWMRGVRRLSLRENAIDDRCCEALARSPHLEALEELQLYQNALTKAGVRVLLGAFPALRKLGVYGVKLSNAERAQIRATRPTVEVMI